MPFVLKGFQYTCYINLNVAQNVFISSMICKGWTKCMLHGALFLRHVKLILITELWIVSFLFRRSSQISVWVISYRLQINIHILPFKLCYIFSLFKSAIIHPYSLFPLFWLVISIALITIKYNIHLLIYFYFLSSLIKKLHEDLLCLMVHLFTKNRSWQIAGNS